MIDPLLPTLLGLLLGLLLIAAGVHKLATLASFRETLSDYKLLPAVLVAPSALLIPVIECALGLAWLARIALTATALTTAVMFTVYGLAIALNLWRGRVHIHCGCGFGGSGQQLSWWQVTRNGLLTGLALLTMMPSTARSLGALDGFSLAAGLLVLLLLYAAWLQLMANRAAMAVWRARRA